MSNNQNEIRTYMSLELGHTSNIHLLVWAYLIKKGKYHEYVIVILNKNIDI